MRSRFVPAESDGYVAACMLHELCDEMLSDAADAVAIPLLALIGRCQGLQSDFIASCVDLTL